MKRFLCLGALGLALAAPTLADGLNYNVVEFNESASVRVPNDMMTVVLRVEERGTSRMAVSEKVTRRMNAVLSRVRTNRAFEAESGNRSVYAEYDDKHIKIKSWTDSAEIYVKSQDFNALSKLVADSQNDAVLSGMSFGVSPKKYAAAVDEASDKALRAFRLRAEHLSRTLGFSGYKIVNLKLAGSFENAVEYSAAPTRMMMRAEAVMADAAPVMDTDSGVREIRQTVRASVQMQ